MKAFILDVDGVLTDGKMWYTKDGKVMKAFGADDNDALKMLKEYIHIEFVSGDYNGFEISKKRVEDMGFKITLVQGVEERTEWVKRRWFIEEVIYMGDSFMDASLLKRVGYGVCPANGS